MRIELLTSIFNLLPEEFHMISLGFKLDIPILLEEWLMLNECMLKNNSLIYYKLFLIFKFSENFTKA
jgi:hypothetical protein